MTTRRRPECVLSILVALLLVVGVAACGASAPRGDPQPLRGAILGSFEADLRALAGGDVAPEFGGLESGVVTPGFTRARAGVAYLAARLARARSAPDLAGLSQRTWDFVLRTAPVRFDGAIGSAADGSADAVDTMFTGTALGLTALELRGAAPPQLLARWTSVVVHAADFLRTNGNVTFYTNGNVNIGNSLLFRLAFALTGDQRWRETYEEALAFTLAPPGPRWNGFGLKMTREPATADGSDGSGYLAEKGEGGIGYDADYTQIQADQVARLYLLDRDPRILRLLNLLTNSVLARVDRMAWTLDTSGGTRHPRPDRRVGFFSGAPAVLALVGCRDDLATTAVELGRAKAAAIHAIVSKQVEQDYGLLGAGPPNMIAALADARPDCSEEDR